MSSGALPGIYSLFDKRQRTATASPEPAAPVSVPRDGLHPYAAAAITAELGRLAALPRPWRQNSYWDQTTFEVACNLIELAHSPWSGYSLAQARADLRSYAPADEAWGEREHEQKWESALDRIGGIGRPEPAPGELPPVTTINPTPPPPPPAAAATGETEGEPQVSALEAWREQVLAQEVERIRIRREAEKIVRAEEEARTWREPPWRPTLTEELAIPDEPVSYLVDDIFPTGGNVLLTAQYKTGKTTLVNAFARALADEEQFLGRLDTHHTEGRIALWNYEVDGNQYRRWLRELGIVNTDRVTVLNLRGYRMPVLVPHVEDWIVRWLTDRRVTTWVVDPFARAFVGSGTSENDNTEVGAFLDTLDVIKDRAGVQQLVLPTHTGRGEMEQGQERARGATRLDDWADVRWLLTKDDQETRFFRATGRDVDFPEEKLDYDEGTRTLTLGGGDRAWEQRRRRTEAVVAVVNDNPGIGLAALRTAVREAGVKGRNDAIDAAINEAEFSHQIIVEKGGSGAATRHFPARTTVIGTGETA